MIEKIPIESPDAPLTDADRAVFGADARRHPQLGFILQRGFGALSEAGQAELYLREVAADHGLAVANELREKLAGVGRPAAAPEKPRAARKRGAA